MSETAERTMKPGRRPQPSDDPLWAASRFAYLYASINVLGGVVGACVLAMAPTVSGGVACGSAFLVALVVAYCAQGIRTGSVKAARIAVSLAVLDAVGSSVSAYAIVEILRRPVLMLVCFVPIGIRLVLAYEMWKPFQPGAKQSEPSGD